MALYHIDSPNAEAPVTMIYCRSNRYVTLSVDGQCSENGNTVRRGSANGINRLGRNGRPLADLTTNRHIVGGGRRM
ncbi:hypothetical protein BJY00DRAFT_289493 [Aspergillus carlsbadensis]|nr:hypothetical protein BJY00DRAFT_289493 [Aspergillus carlsbadensis]